MGSEPFVAQIQIFGCNFAPKGWATCDGQILPISQNTALFSLVGVQYGGNGTSTFALPDLRGQVPVSQGTGPGLSQYSVGEQLGSSAVTLLTNQMPAHNHNVNCYDDAGTLPSLAGNVLATSGSDSRGNVIYNTATTGNTVNMNPAAIALNGSSVPHNNMSPYLTLNYCIALQGIFPSRN